MMPFENWPKTAIKMQKTAANALLINFEGFSHRFAGIAWYT